MPGNWHCIGIRGLVTGEWLELDSGLLQPRTATTDIDDWHRLLTQLPWGQPLLSPTAA